MSVPLLKAEMPDDMDRAIAIYPEGDRTVCRWFGMTREQVASHLYQIADEIVNQMPLPSKTKN
jgi:hypothetical protein